MMYCQNVTHAFRRCLLQSHQCIGMRMNQDPSLCMFRHFYRDVIYRGSLRKRNIMIGRVVVRYDWQFSRFYVQEMSKMIIFIVPVPFSQDSP